MRARVALAEYRRTCRLNGNDLDVRILALEILAGAGNSAAGAYARNKDVNIAVGILPDLRAGGRLVHSRVCRVYELTRDKAVRQLLRKLVRLRDRALHALCALGQHKLCTVSLHQLAALHAHGLRHYDDDAVAACGCNTRQTDAGVAGGRLDDDRARLEQALCLSVVDHCLCDAVLDAAGRIEVLELRQNLCFELLLLLDMHQLQKRSAADQLVCGCVNLAHDNFLPIYLVVIFYMINCVPCLPWSTSRTSEGHLVSHFYTNLSCRFI